MIVQDKNFSDIKIGDSASFEKIITADDLDKFADLSGDHNPLHMDEKYAARSEFKSRVVFGMLLGAWVSRLVGMDLPGKKALLLKEGLEFKKPAYIGDKILVKGTVTHKSEATRLLDLAIEISKDKELLSTGSVQVRVL